MTQIANDIMHKLYGKNIYEHLDLALLHIDPQGWNGNHASLKRLVSMSTRGAIVIDVGAWKGQSTMTMAQAMRDNNIDGCVIAVDTWLGSAEHWFQPLTTLYERMHGMPDLYNRFLGNVLHAGLQDIIVPMPTTSSIAYQVLRHYGVYAEIVHIDAAHDYEDVIREISNYWEILIDGGHLIGDDYTKEWEGVVRAANEFSTQVGRILTIEPPKWILRK